MKFEECQKKDHSACQFVSDDNDFCSCTCHHDDMCSCFACKVRTVGFGQVPGGYKATH